MGIVNQCQVAKANGTKDPDKTDLFLLIIGVVGGRVVVEAKFSALWNRFGGEERQERFLNVHLVAVCGDNGHVWVTGVVLGESEC